MNGALDTSVLVAALVPRAEFHAESLALLNRGSVDRMSRVAENECYFTFIVPRMMR